MTVKKPQSSYLIFCNEQRRHVMNDNAGVRIGEIQKIISAQWNQLTPKEKDFYVQLAANDKARYNQELLDNPQIKEEPSDIDKTALISNTCLYPLGRVRKIVQSDSDVSKVSKDALVAIAKASELFAQLLGIKSYEQALYRNKRQVKTSDVARAIQTTASLDWLRQDFPEVKPAQTNTTAHRRTINLQEKEVKTLPDCATFFKPKSSSEVS
ncbi:hypothetical protein CCR75_005670 [Bremia lactucae]|uniref:HMG box domain-containing protein n=1 Tax=Bremia lactucae TaxID=4779 RepID=A0A976FLF7_BRELC|nr:hypothetical protein CCR75_005670 [Bremia lactucae]